MGIDLVPDLASSRPILLTTFTIKRLFNFASDSKLDLPHPVLILFTSEILVVRPFRVVHEAKASYYIFKHP